MVVTYMKPSRKRAPIGFGTGSVASGSTFEEASGRSPASFGAAAAAEAPAPAPALRQRQRPLPGPARRRFSHAAARPCAGRADRPNRAGQCDRVPRRHALLRVRGPRDRQAGRHPGHRLRLRDHRPGGARDRAPDRRSDGHQVAGAHRRAHEGGRREVRRQRRRGGRLRQGHPQARDRRPHAARRARGPQGRGEAGVLRGRRLGRPAQAAGDDLLPGRRHRHRAGGRGAARQGRAPPLLHDPAVQRLHGEGGRSPPPA